jgi:hypothetical protein
MVTLTMTTPVTVSRSQPPRTIACAVEVMPASSLPCAWFPAVRTCGADGSVGEQTVRLQGDVSQRGRDTAVAGACVGHDSRAGLVVLPRRLVQGQLAWVELI